MSDLHEQQRSFIHYLLEQPSTIVNDIESTQKWSAVKRLNIYANAYKLRLKEAIMTDYDSLASYLGDKQIDQVMELYIKKYPSHTTSLRYFSVNMPELLQSEIPFKHFPEVYELACIEQAFANSFDAKDQAIASLAELATLPQQAWTDLKFNFQASLQRLALHTNSFTIWQSLSKKQTPAKAENTATANWILWRRSDLITHYRTLSDAENAALEMAVNGDNFAMICERLLDFYNEQETPVKAIGFLQSWLQEELLTSFDYSLAVDD